MTTDDQEGGSPDVRVGALPFAQPPGGPAGAAATPTGLLPPKPKPVEDDEDEVSIEEMGEICADIYGDAFTAVSSVYAGEPLELGEKRLQRRGKQIAVVLRKLGWEDDEILCYVGLTAGAAGDFAIMHRHKQQLDAERKAAAAAATTAAPATAAPGPSAPSTAPSLAAIAPGAGPQEVPA